MKKYSESTYGESVADIYDRWYTEFDPHAISTLVEFAQGGRALELGIGTGRIALPIYQAGVEVHGIDSSPAMTEKLYTKPGGQNIPIKHGDFADIDIEGQFELIYVVLNTFFGIQTQDDQLRCFINTASHLAPNGVFVIEAFVPDMSRYTDNQTVRSVEIGDDDLRFEVTQIDPLNQQVNSKLIHITDDGTRMYPVKIRYAWPAELDLMAKIAGLELLHRWGSWDKRKLTNQDSKHISVYGFPD